MEKDARYTMRDSGQHRETAMDGSTVVEHKKPGIGSPGEVTVIWSLIQHSCHSERVVRFALNERGI